MAASSTPIVSVVMPIYNGARYLHAALRSILDQTLRDIELIAIDDASVDGTSEILASAARMDTRMRVIQNRSNLGLVASLNAGIEAARGKFIARMDQDDISHGRRLETQTRWIEANGCHVCGTWTWNFSGWAGDIVRFPETNDAIQTYLLFNSAIAHPTVLASADVLRRNRYSDAHRFVEDYELWTRLSLEGYRLGNVPSPLLKYRIHLTQMGNVTRREQHQAAMTVRTRYLLGRFRWATPADAAVLETVTQSTRGISLDEQQAAGDLFRRLWATASTDARVVLPAQWHAASLRAMGNGVEALGVYGRVARSMNAPSLQPDLAILGILRAVYGSRTYRTLRQIHRLARQRPAFMTMPEPAR